VEGIDTASVLDHPHVVCHSNGQSGKRRIWRHLSGVSNNTNLGVYNNNLSVGHRAFMERYFFCVTKDGPKPALGAQESEFREDVHLIQFWTDVVKGLRGAPVAELLEVVNSYEGAKREMYHKAMLEYYAYGVTEKHSRLKSFVKFEKQNLRKAPRVINPRTPIYNLLLAAYVKFAEKRIFAAINRVYGDHTSHTIIKGVNSIEQAAVLRAKWGRFTNPVAVGLDAAKFDMHVSKWCLVYEHMFYLGIHSHKSFGALWKKYSQYLRSHTPHRLGSSYNRMKDGERPALSWLLKQQVFNNGKAYFTDGTLKFKMEGTRSSGDINTSLGNCIIMCGLIHAWLKRVGVDAELANNGDDCVVIMERSDLDKFMSGIVEYFEVKGFRMEVEDPVIEFEQIEFCQSHPVNTGRFAIDGEPIWTMVRNLDTALVKGAMCLIPIANDRAFRKWMGAVGQCEGSLNIGIPVMQNFAAAYRRNGLKATRKFVNEVYRGSTRAHHAPSTKVEELEILPAARASFYMAFGVRPDEQIALEQHFDHFSYDRCVSPVPGQDAMNKPLFIVPPIMHLVSPLN